MCAFVMFIILSSVSSGNLGIFGNLRRSPSPQTRRIIQMSSFDWFHENHFKSVYPSMKHHAYSIDLLAHSHTEIRRTCPAALLGFHDHLDTCPFHMESEQSSCHLQRCHDLRRRRCRHCHQAQSCRFWCRHLHLLLHPKSVRAQWLAVLSMSAARSHGARADVFGRTARVTADLRRNKAT